jgi:hypothetical protein
MIIDYLYHQKFVPSVPNPLSRRPGEARQPLAIPAQPNLSLKGRTPASLLRAVEEWHARLRAPVRGTSVEWESSGIRPFSFESGEGPSRQLFAITELISYAELHDEGAAMRHCVASYWMRCYARQCSIWSLTVEDSSGTVTRLLTLEVRISDRQLIQAKGPDNREPDDLERFLLTRWAESGGPSLGRGLLLEVEED